MQLPSRLCQAITMEISSHNLRALTQAASELSALYRSHRAAKGIFMDRTAYRLAYLAVRMPATFAANCAVFMEMRRLLSDRPITSLLDLGAGPGTAGWAATEIFEEIQQITLLEQDEELIRLGKSLARKGEHTLLEQADWLQVNLRETTFFPMHDLVVSSYTFGEFEPPVAREILKTAWNAARTALVIIEPGTMRGFELIRLLRSDLIALGGQVIAPCPHQAECPIPLNDWCHFSQRLDRSAFHRRIKLGTHGYEDEKFSYLVVSKSPIKPVQARVIRHPLRRSGHTRLLLCTRDGLQTITVTRSDTKQWKQARKISWGDEYPWP